ncbi:MAG: carbamoyltransferase C-terminal domain-containing protein [Actinomycetota bacterium]
MAAILGLNAYHGDASAALVVDGDLVAAAEEERFVRLNHVAGFPAQAAAWCLEHAGLTVADLDHVAVSRDPRANIGQKLLRTVRHGASARYLKDRLQNATKLRDVGSQLGPGLRAQVHNVEHHHTHVASAFFVSPFEEAAILSVDGFGDFASTMTAVGRGSHYDVLDRVLFPHSLGIFYTAFSQWLGFPDYGDEGKAMGLAPYGDASVYAKAMADVVRPLDDFFELNLDYFTHDKEGVDMTWDAGAPTIGPIFSDKLVDTFGPPRPAHGNILQLHSDVAAALQRRLEEIYLHVIDRLHARTQLPSLCLAGGVALNAVANGRVRDESPFERLWVQPAAGDSGTAIGAAFFVWNRVLKQPRSYELTHVYLGPEYEERPEGSRPLDYAEVAQRIADGAVVGWFQGRMEFGPRALGDRSILADPRRADMKDTLNARIKYREGFRPFAPSILAERVGEWYEHSDASPFMVVVDHSRREKRERIPAVDHADGTGRVQTVDAATNPRFHRLISEFEAITGVPILLNTSFNENEPIVMTPQDAIDTFRKTSMDLLVLGDYVLER